MRRPPDTVDRELQDDGGNVGVVAAMRSKLE
jgi:hypothetical protein